MLSTKQALRLGKGEGGIISRDMLEVVDREQKPRRLTYTLTDMPDNGFLFLKGTLLQLGDRFTQRDINRGRLSYKSLPEILQVTDNERSKTLKGLAGNNIVWEESDGNDFEIFLHDIVTGQTTQLTNNAFDDTVVGMSGSRIVWSGLLEDADAWDDEIEAGPDNNLFLFDGRATTQLTTGAAHDKLVSIDGRKIFWRSAIGPAPSGVLYQPYSYELFFFNSQTTRRLTKNDDDDSVQAVDGRHIVWSSPARPKGGRLPSDELFWFNGRSTTRLTRNDVDERWAEMDFPYIAWNSRMVVTNRPRRVTDEVILLNLKTKKQNRLTRNTVDDYLEAIAGTKVVWSSYVGKSDSDRNKTPELFLFDGKNKIRLTRNKADDDLRSFDGRNLIWSSYIGPRREGWGPTNEIFWSNGRVTRRLTNNAVDDVINDYRGSEILWTSQVGSMKPYSRIDTNVFYFDGKTIRQMTNEATFKVDARFTDTGMVWFSEVGPSPGSDPRPTTELYSFDAKTDRVTRMTDNAFEDENLYVSGSTLTWESGPWNETDIFLGNVASRDRFRFTVIDGRGGTANGRFNIRFPK